MTPKEKRALKRRTIQQNKAIHLYLEWLSLELNIAGLDMKKVLKPHIDIPWTAENAKEHLWRPIQRAVTEKKSTTELDKGEVSMVYETLNRHISEKFSIHVAFPDRNDMLKYEEEMGKKKNQM